MSSSFVIYLLSFGLLTISLFMILLVLVQRGRGGGLAGAFGGLGGQSAFGTRAGDIFTKITIVVAVLFVVVAAVLGIAMRGRQKALDTGTGGRFVQSGDAGPEDAGDAAPVLTAEDEPFDTDESDGKGTEENDAAADDDSASAEASETDSNAERSDNTGD